MNNRSSRACSSSRGRCLLLLVLLPLLASAQPRSRPASILSVRVVGSPQAPEVEITSSEPITPQAQALNGPDRVVIDFPGALPASQLKSFAVNRGGIRRVRIGIFQATPPITRVVVDLTTSTDYRLIPSGNTVIARIGSPSPSAAPAEKSSWISQREVALPRAKTEATAAAGRTNSQDQELGYWISQQDVHRFTGEWSVLKGKNALFLLAQRRGVRSDIVPGEEKIVFLKRILAESYRTAIQSPTAIEGVVVIFAGGRGAVAGASMTDIRQWIEGGLSDDAFIARCSLDPPAEFPQPAHTE